MRQLVSRTERTPNQSDRVAEELPRLCRLAALRDRAGQVDRQDQRLLVLCAEQAGLLDNGLVLDLHGPGVLALPRVR